MAKIVISDIGSGFDLTKINSAFQQLEDELNNKVLYRNVPPGEANYMSNDLDMNQNDIINAGKVQATTFAFADGKSIDDIIAEAEYWAEQSESSSNASATWAENARLSAESAAASALVADMAEDQVALYANNANNSAILAQSSAVDAQIQAEAAEQYSLLGLSANTSAFDLGYVSDSIVIFPTDLGPL